MQEKIEKYETIKKLGEKLFAQSNVAKTGKVIQHDIEVAKQLLIKAISALNSEVMASYFEHIIIAPELGRRIAKELEVRSSELEINKDEIEFLLWLHEIGRLVDASAYLTDELIDLRLLTDFGIPKRITETLLPLDEFKKAAISHNTVSSFFTKLTPAQRIVNLADNFGKRDEKGRLFNLKSLFTYLKSERSRYGANPNWKPEYDLLQEETVEKTMVWLAELGVDLDAVLKELHDYGPKFVIVARHGELDNPKNIVYNLDQVMDPADIIHITEYGKEQMRSLGKVIKKRKFRVKSLHFSNQTRAKESASALNEILGIQNSQEDETIRDVYAPGPYHKRLKMDDFQKMGGDAHNPELWKQYHHESPEAVINRFNNSFWTMVEELEAGETGIMVSHGDPIAWWINTQVSEKIPKPKELRNLIYPNKGEAIVVVINPQGKFFTYYFLTDPSLKKGKIY